VTDRLIGKATLGLTLQSHLPVISDGLASLEFCGDCNGNNLSGEVLTDYSVRNLLFDCNVCCACATTFSNPDNLLICDWVVSSFFFHYNNNIVLIVAASV